MALPRRLPRTAGPATAIVLVGLAALGCNVGPDTDVDFAPDGESNVGRVESALPDCNVPNPPPICDPELCRPRCFRCGGPNGCGGICSVGTCPTPGDTCGGGGVTAQCGHPVDLRGFQTSIRHQGGRDTCTAFAVTAAVEAAYKHRYGLDLDLSEQFLHHVQKSYWLDPNAPLPGPEIQPETNGGGNVPWNFTVLTRYGLPPESTLPYIGTLQWQKPEEWLGPVTRATFATQRGLDDFMLSDVPRTYLVPNAIVATVLPSAALAEARFRPTATRFANYTELSQVAWFKAELDAGREVAFDVELTDDDRNPSNDVWEPGSVAGPTHAMLLVGYDDRKRAFWVKNSVGGTVFPYFSYDWVTQGRVRSAMTILDVADPHRAFGAAQNPHLFMGRWNLDFDGWRGTLDIYRLPGGNDARVGTYFGPDGVARRVNGAISGNRIELWIDWDQPDLPVNAAQGMRFHMFLYESDRDTMAGLMTGEDGNRWTAIAQKGKWTTGIPGAANISTAAYAGRWLLSTDGRGGDVRLSATSTGTITGTYIDSLGNVTPVSGNVAADRRMFSFTAGTTYYQGYLNGHSLGVMTGAAIRGTDQVGFHGIRIGS